MSMDQKFITSVIENAVEFAEAFEESLKHSLPEGGFQSRPLEDIEFFRWFSQKLVEHPPMPITNPEGQTQVVSPWLAALMLCENGKQEVTRWERIQREGLPPPAVLRPTEVV